MTITNQTKMDANLIDQVEVKSEDRLIGYANKYNCTIKFNRKQATFEYTDSVNNTDLGNEPKLKDVLYCLIMDHSSKDYDFEEFCSEFGYDADSIKAQKIHIALLKNGEKMDRVFGNNIEQLQKEFEGY